MRKLLVSLVIGALTLCAYAQKDVTQFLGIPIDGDKSELISKLKKKGFKKTKFAGEPALAGRFNDTDVIIEVATNGNKVYRVIVADAKPSNEREIKIQYNNLCHQFSNNDKYLSIDDFTIPEEEDISYQMTVNKKIIKRYFFNFQPR